VPLAHRPGLPRARQAQQRRSGRLGVVGCWGWLAAATLALEGSRRGEVQRSVGSGRGRRGRQRRRRRRSSTGGGAAAGGGGKAGGWATWCTVGRVTRDPSRNRATPSFILRQEVMPHNRIMDCCDSWSVYIGPHCLKDKEPSAEISQVMITYLIYSMTYHI
jgi:hypothetical protein